MCTGVELVPAAGDLRQRCRAVGRGGRLFGRGADRVVGCLLDPSLRPAAAWDDSRKRCRRLSNSHCIAGATELSPSMPSPARSPRSLRPGAWDLDVATAWLPKCWTATLRKRKGRPRRPPSLTAADRGKRPLSGLAFVRLMRRAGATASRVHLTPRAAGAPSAPTEAPPWPLPTDALGHRRSPAWPRS